MKRLMPKAIYELFEIAYNVPAYLRLRRAARAFKPDLIYERYNLNLVAGLWLKRATRVPMLLEVNAPLARERADHGGVGLKRMAQRLERLIWKSADMVLPVSNVLADEVRRAGGSADRVVVVPNAIDPVRFSGDADGDAAKAEFGVSGKIVLGFAGFVRDWHGLGAVIELLGQRETPPSLAMLVVGEGPALPALKARARALGIGDRVHFAGLIGR